MGSHSDGPRGPLPGPGECNDFDVTLPASAMPEFGEGGSADQRPGPGPAAEPAAQPMPRAEYRSEVPEIADITVGELLGKGGQGVVYRGFQEFLARDVAIKVLHRSVDRDVSRFRQEATLLASLHHPNIVACYQAGVGVDEECYMVLEFVDGPDLFGYVKQNGAQDERVALGLALDVARGLEHGYEQGSRMIHRDIKPQNILIQETSSASGPRLRAKVVDLGLARCLEESMELTREGAVMGTPVSMAPEQFDSPREADHRTDIYGLGCVLFYALTGDPAFKGVTITAIYKQKVDEKTSRPHRDIAASPATKALLDKMLCPQQDGRHATYEELIEEIRGAMEGLEGRATEGAGRRTRWVAGLGGAVAVMGGAAALGMGLIGGDKGAGESGLDEQAMATLAPAAAVAQGASSEPADDQGAPGIAGPTPVGPRRVLAALLDPLAPGVTMDLIQRDNQLMSWRGDYQGHGEGTREHAFWRFVLEGRTPCLEGQPLMSLEGEQTKRSAAELLGDLRGRGSVEPLFVPGSSELSHRLPQGDWVFEGDIALRRRKFSGALLGGVAFHRADGSYLEVCVAVVMPSEEAGASAGKRRPRAVVRSVWFGADGEPMGDGLRDSRDFPGESTVERSNNFMAEGTSVMGDREEVVLSLRLEHSVEEGVVLCLGDYLVLDLETPADFGEEPVRQVAAFARIGDVALRRWRLSGD